MLDNIKLGTQEQQLADKSVVHMPITMRPKTQEFVEAIASKHPTWTFIPNYVTRNYENVELNGRTYSQVSELLATDFSVMQGKDELGRIGAEYWGANKFTITNKRIQKQRERGSVTRTSDLKKAIKLVEKMFFPKTDTEVLKEVREQAVDRLSNYTRKHRYDLDNVWRNMQRTAILFIKENMDEYKAFSAHVTIDGVDKFEEFWDARNNAQTLEDNFNNDSASMVTIINDVFYFSFKTKKPIAFERDNVSPEVKARIGMLKLLAVGGAIDNVGLKCEDDVFIINLPNIVSQGEPYAVS